jgi:hypothetical protein
LPPEHRRADRLGLCAAAGEVLVVQPMLVTEMSRTGMQVETACALLVDSLHEFRLTLAGRAMVVKGRVAHSRISAMDGDVVTYVSGVEFVGLSEVTAAAIDEFVVGIRAHRDALQRGDRLG